MARIRPLTIASRFAKQVTWYINGQLVVDDATHKVLVNEAGNHSLMISKASLSDAGVITCVAKNKSGEANFQVRNARDGHFDN